MNEKIVQDIYDGRIQRYLDKGNIEIIEAKVNFVAWILLKFWAVCSVSCNLCKITYVESFKF
jgi:hypothetical protein